MRPAGPLSRAASHRPQLAWLHSLWVSPRLRGRGLADEVIMAIEEWARPRVAHVRLAVVPGNGRAIALYKRHR